MLALTSLQFGGGREKFLPPAHKLLEVVDFLTLAVGEYPFDFEAQVLEKLDDVEILFVEEHAA